jgi:hypothetical protein
MHPAYRKAHFRLPRNFLIQSVGDQRQSSTLGLTRRNEGEPICLSMDEYF